jgi:hypothetical protein
MAVIRTYHNKENPYVQINKQALWDENLSLEAVGLWARLLSRPDDWTFKVSEIAKSCSCSKERIYRILNELIDNGYAARYQANDKGKFQSFETYVFEFKTSKEEIQKMLPQPGFPDTVIPGSGNPVTTNKDPTKDIKKKREEAAPPPPILFSDRRVKMNQDRYERLVEEFGLEKIKKFIDRLDEYADINPKRFKQYACHATVIRKWIREDNEKPVSKKFDNEKFAEDLCKKLNHPLVHFIRGKSLIIETGGQGSPIEIFFTDNGFKDQVFSEFRKRNIPIPEGMQM